MSSRPVAVDSLEIQARPPGVAQRLGIDVIAKCRAVGGDVVTDELAEDRPPGGDGGERIGKVVRGFAVAQSARIPEHVEKRLVGL
jgi:hypothetical protein